MNYYLLLFFDVLLILLPSLFFSFSTFCIHLLFYFSVLEGKRWVFERSDEGRGAVLRGFARKSFKQVLVLRSSKHYR